METNTSTNINPALMTASEKREWTLSVARRMMANKHEIQAGAVAEFKNNPARTTRILSELARLRDDSTK